MKGGIYILVFFVILFVIVGTTNVYSQSRSDEPILANQIVQIKGTLKAFDDEQKTLIPVCTQSIIFQRLDCKKCLISTRTNCNGEYEIFVSKGKYKVYVYAFNDDNRLYDAVSPNQVRIVNAQYKYQPTQFDIIVNYSKSKIKTEPIVIETN